LTSIAPDLTCESTHARSPRGQLEDTLSGETGALASVIDRGIEELFLEFPPR
jgi:hypothetical protein